MNYYNDNDPFCCAWIQELIKAGLVPKGEVDDRPIQEVRSADLAGLSQCHFFAGIAGWPRALELAGWDSARPVWTGSCPCQPLSCAGKGLGERDERHLWPVWYELIRECRPPEIFGEQVASAAGREWMSGVRLDLEALGYDVGAADLPAACVGAPHKRNRLFWVAKSSCFGWRGRHNGNQARNSGALQIEGLCPTCRLADFDTRRPQDRWTEGERSNVHQGNEDHRPKIKEFCTFWSDSIAIPCADGKWRRVPGGVADNISERRYATEPTSETSECIYGESITKDAERRIQGIESPRQIEIERLFQLMVTRLSDRMGDSWNDGVLEALNCFPLAESIPGHVGILRGAGNAIVPQVAAEFIRAFMECESQLTT